MPSPPDHPQPLDTLRILLVVRAKIGSHQRGKRRLNAGNFAGEQIHSRDYRNVRDIDGGRVRAVGAGDSGCDMVAEVAFAGFEATLSMRRG
ncbi:hypothetical protein HFO49_26070 [Rhizobium leguminosarum]|uniref:hypothetical protein n=1 Tax=Rhizobium leguminosarum TaxID=384 RepID=UPI001C9604F4|nr:hypothetical protein [Rhizobium leguminosarum]